MRNRVIDRSTPLAGISLIALIVANAAAAQQTDADDEIIVRGTALNYSNSVAGKRNADGISDMFDTDEIGRLPDKNIGETLNRIPGISMLLEKGEGRFVQIRGVAPQLNNVTINGMSMGGAETENGGRLVPMDVVGGELLGSVQVTKTPTPDMDGQGIGGTLNLTTKQPFDFDGDFTLLASSRIGVETIDSIGVAETKQTPWSADLTAAGKLADNKLGWLAGASYSNRKTPLPGIFQDDWRPVTFDPDPAITGDEQTINIPTNVKNNVTVVGRQRINVNGALEFRPDDTQKYYVRGFFARWDELQLRNRFEQGLSNNLIAVDGDSGGTVERNRVQVNLRSEPTDKELLSISLGGENTLGPWTIDYSGQRNDNLVDEPNTNWEFRSGASTFGPDTFTIQDDGAVTITSTGNDRQDPQFQALRRLRLFKQRTDETGYIAAANVKRDLGVDWADEAFLKFGGKWTRTKRQLESSEDNYAPGATSFTLAAAPSLTRGGFTNPVPAADLPNLWLDLDGLNAFFEANRNNPALFVLNEEQTFIDQFQSDFRLRERIVAGYGMGKAAFGPFTLIAGVRVEQTDVDSSAFAIVTDQNGDVTAEPVEDGGSYTNVLPSIIGTVELPHDVVLRAAWTNAVGRPNYDDLAPRASLDVSDDPTIGTIGSLEIGNPDLKARESSNFDISLEWYFEQGSLLAVSLFYKDIDNEIIPAPEQRIDNGSFQGQTFDRLDINTTINAQSAKVKGVEVQFVDQFDFLPSPFDGLGFAGSVTFLDSGVDVERGGETIRLPLVQQADRSTSLTLYYQKGPLDISGTYNHNTNFLTDFGATRELDLDQGGFGRFDFRAQYSFNDNLKFFVEGINLNNEPTTEFQGGIKRQNTEFEFSGRTFFIGVTARL